jgi:hypothetical protein
MTELDELWESLNSMINQYNYPVLTGYWNGYREGLRRAQRMIDAMKKRECSHPSRREDIDGAIICNNCGYVVWKPIKLSDFDDRIW